MFKRIYIEITNNCNLNCSFCKGTKRSKMFIDMYSFNVLLKKIEGYTKYVYFHITSEIHAATFLMSETLNMSSLATDAGSVLF